MARLLTIGGSTKVSSCPTMSCLAVVPAAIAAPPPGPRAQTIGLVLEGGGAKGAFQFGCLQALHEACVTFDAIAGTSVGSLNAALWATGQIEWGTEFWATISFEKVYPLRRPAIVFSPLALVYAITKAISDWLARRPLFQFALFSGVFYYGCAGIIGMLGLLSMAAFVLVTGRVDLPWAEYTSLTFKSLLVFSPVFLLIIVERLGLSAFTSQPLATALSRQLEHVPFSVPVFATVAHRSQVFDPDNLEYVSTGIPPATPFEMPASRLAYTPAYHRIDTLERPDALRSLLASAALPFGVVPGIDGCVDGGLADNIPIYPLVSLRACDLVLIIRCNPGDLTQTGLLESWQYVDRLLRITKYDAESAHDVSPQARPRYHDEKIDRLNRHNPAEPKRWPDNQVSFSVIAPNYPRKSLIADLLSRTMNFRSSFTRRQMADGYAAANRWIEDGGLAILAGFYRPDGTS